MRKAIKAVVKKAAISFLKYREKATGKPFQYLFILSHMRSGSTLLNHILMSHPDILGCGERNARYDKDEDLETLRFQTYFYHKNLFSTYQYVVDQINHNKFIGNDTLLTHPKIRVIFLIREPVATVTSMVRVLGQFYDTTLDESVSYYVDRLSTLSRYSRALKDKNSAVFTTYDDLLNNTSTTLRNLQEFLGLRSELSERYRRFEFTGLSGDPGPNIQLGKVNREKSPHSLDIPSNDLVEIRKAYDGCAQTLQDNCLK